MINQNKQKYISFIVLILVIVLGIFLLNSKKADAPADTIGGVEIPDNTITTPINNGGNTSVNPTNPVVEQKDLLAKLQKAVDARDFESFALVLQEVYKNNWNNEEFTKLESELYVYATNEYWVKGDLANSLKVSTVVYNKVSEAWRFRYLRIVTLEKYGRNAFDAGDPQTAENYANQILQMMFRPEGTNLMADIYISRIKTNIKDGNTELAKQNLGFIWDYEVSQGRRDTLNELKKQLGL